MKPKSPNQNHIMKEGKNTFENTDEFKAKAEAKKKEVKDKYAPEILGERSQILKFILRIRQNLETRKRIQEISSSHNLHLKKKVK